MKCRDHHPQLESAARVAVVRQMQIVLAYGVQVTTLEYFQLQKHTRSVSQSVKI